MFPAARREPPVRRRLRDAAARDGEVGGQAILAAQADRRVVDVGHVGAGRRKRIEGVAVEVADRRTRAEGQIGFAAINGNLAPLRDRMARVAVTVWALAAEVRPRTAPSATAPIIVAERIMAVSFRAASLSPKRLSFATKR